MARYYLPTTSLDFGRINGNAVSFIDLDRLEWIRLLYLDHAGAGAANPWGISWLSNGKTIVVSHAGTHELSLIDPPLLPQKPARLRTRVRLPGNGPRALCATGERVYAANYFSDSLSCIDLKEVVPQPVSLLLAAPRQLSPVRMGEMLFNDARLCFQQWQSCASCHDSDARSDGLNWDLLNDGMGNPKNARSLVWSHRTPPVMALGVRKTSEVAVRAGIKHILFTEQPEEVAEAIDAYLQSLDPAAGPVLTQPALSEAIARGQKLFSDEDIGCARCHPYPLFTDLKAHRVGTTGKYDDGAERFDTPGLVELWRTAPFLHDGSAATLVDLLTVRNEGDLHGKTSHLTSEQIQDLATYLLSL